MQIIKSADSIESKISLLKLLKNHPDANHSVREKIDREIRNIYSGAKAEKDAAYQMESRLSDQSWFVLHDLRLEHNGAVAQIDHLVLHRLYFAFVCESKNFSEGIAINDALEFTAFYNGKPQGISSPIEQNKRHITFLQRLLSNDDFEFPKILGAKLNFDIYNYVLIGSGARIQRPKKQFPELDYVIKADQFSTSALKVVDNLGVMQTLKRAAADMNSLYLEEIGHSLARMHIPQTIDYYRKFNLSKPASEIPPLVVQSQIPSDQKSHATEHRSDDEDVCGVCLEKIPPKVAKYCRENKEKFRGQLLCRTHQNSQNSAIPKDASPDLTAVPSSQASDVILDNNKPSLEVQESAVEISPDADGGVEFEKDNKRKCICDVCNEKIPFSVARYCWLNKKKFNGKTLCRTHQNEVANN